jgi:hypothetical protein
MRSAASTSLICRIGIATVRGFVDSLDASRRVPDDA